MAGVLRLIIFNQKFKQVPVIYLTYLTILLLDE
jgi:hypothetical protein